jgi:hypothetical protein
MFSYLRQEDKEVDRVRDAFRYLDGNRIPAACISRTSAEGVPWTGPKRPTRQVSQAVSEGISQFFHFIFFIFHTPFGIYKKYLDYLVRLR